MTTQRVSYATITFRMVAYLSIVEVAVEDIYRHPTEWSVEEDKYIEYYYHFFTSQTDAAFAAMGLAYSHGFRAPRVKEITRVGSLLASDVYEGERVYNW